MASLLNMSGSSLLKKESLLPSGYKQLEYITPDGNNAYIDTGIQFSPNRWVNTECVFRCRSTIGGYLNNEVCVIGLHTSKTTYNIGVTNVSNGLYGINASYRTDTNWNYALIKKETEHFHRAIINKPYVQIDDVISQADINVTFSFRMHIFSSPSPKYCDVAYAKFTEEGGSVIKEFIPCIDPNNIVGMYDTVNGVFYSSPNGTAFIAGPKV